MKYDVNYFINKFEAIPENKWCTEMYASNAGSYCALGHCGLDFTTENRQRYGCPYGAEQAALYSVFGDSFEHHMSVNKKTGVAAINDGKDERYQQPHPKQRILAALYDIKKMQEGQEGKEKVKHVYHAVQVPSSITEQTKELILQ